MPRDNPLIRYAMVVIATFYYFIEFSVCDGGCKVCSPRLADTLFSEEFQMEKTFLRSQGQFAVVSSPVNVNFQIWHQVIALKFFFNCCNWIAFCQLWKFSQLSLLWREMAAVKNRRPRGVIQINQNCSIEISKVHPNRFELLTDNNVKVFFMPVL